MDTAIEDKIKGRGIWVRGRRARGETGEGGRGARGHEGQGVDDASPRCLAREDIACDADEVFWPDPHRRQDDSQLKPTQLYLCSTLHTTQFTQNALQHTQENKHT